MNHLDIGELEHSNLNTYTSSLRLIPPLTFNIGENGQVVSISSEWAQGVDPFVFKRVQK